MVGSPHLPKEKDGLWRGWLDKKGFMTLWQIRFFTFNKSAREISFFADAKCDSGCKGAIVVTSVEDVKQRKGKRQHRFNIHGKSLEPNSSAAAAKSYAAKIFEVHAQSAEAKEAWMQLCKGQDISVEPSLDFSHSNSKEGSAIIKISSTNVGKYSIGAQVTGLSDNGPTGIVVAVHSFDHSDSGPGFIKVQVSCIPSRDDALATKELAEIQKEGGVGQTHGKEEAEAKTDRPNHFRHTRYETAGHLESIDLLQATNGNVLAMNTTLPPASPDALKAQWLSSGNQVDGLQPSSPEAAAQIERRDSSRRKLPPTSTQDPSELRPSSF